jgi:transposase
VFLSCCDHSLTHVAVEYGLTWDKVKQIDKKYLCRWREKTPILQVRWLGVDEVYLGSRSKLYTVISDLQTGQVIGLSCGHQQVSLDGFFTRMGKAFCSKIEVVCIDMWKAFKGSVNQYCPQAKIIYDKFHIIKHLNDAVDEVRRQEFFRQGGDKRELVKGKRWLFLRRWFNLTRDQKGLLNELFAVNRRISVAYQLKEIFGNLWFYKSRAWAKQFLKRWERALRWQRLVPFKKFLGMVKSHLDGILNYCDVKIPLGLVECINGKVKRIMRRIRGCRDLAYFGLKVMFATSPNKNLELIVNHT